MPKKRKKATYRANGPGEPVRIGKPIEPAPSIMHVDETALPARHWRALADGARQIVFDGGRVVQRAFIESKPKAIRRAYAALLLHGERFGFTTADVSSLENAAHALSTPGHDPDISRRLLSLAERIAALVPPSTEIEDRLAEAARWDLKDWRNFRQGTE